MMVYLNGRFLPESRAHISIHDHGFLYGDGVYETLRVREGKVLFLADHLKRLAGSMKGISLKASISIKKMGEAINRTVKANRHIEAAIRLTLTRGPGLPGFDPGSCKKPTLLITSRPFTGYPSHLYQRGMTLAVVKVRRNSPESLPPSIKAISCLNNILAKIESQRVKADEALMLTEDGTVAEGTVSNIFIVKSGRLLTLALDGRQLSGVTRQHVIHLAREQGLRVIETKISVQDLLSADEVFLTSTLMDVMPVGKIIVDRRVAPVGSKKEWPVTRQLMICYTSPRRKSNRICGII